MSMILRYLKFMRNLNIGPGGRRLGSTALRRLNDVRLPVQPLASLNSQERNYVTNVSVKQTGPNHEGNIDIMINQMDWRIKTFGNIDRSEVEEILRVATENGFITSTQALLLIRCCGEFLVIESLRTREEIVKTVWNTIVALGVQLDVSHYNSLLLVNLDNETDFSPGDILLEMKKNNVEPNRVTFQRLIEQYCNKGDIAGVTKILEHMSMQDIPINEIIFNSLIKGHSVAGDIENAVKTKQIMKQAGIEPTSRTHTAILCAHAKNGDIVAIRNELQECKDKDILLENSEILEIIYTLALNKHSQYVDEIISLLVEGSIYNRQTIPCIHRLIEKDCVEIAFKLFKTLMPTRTTKFENEQTENGRFFIKKLVMSDAKPETIVKYCTIMQEENLNSEPFTLALFVAFKNNKHHLALPLLKRLKESGGEIREHYFFPLFVSYSKVNNLQGILNTTKTMISDFEISPSIITLKDYVIPFMVESPTSNCYILKEYNVPFSIAANAVLLHILCENKTQNAAKFVPYVFNLNVSIKLKLLMPHFTNSLRISNDVISFIEILNHQYVYMLNRNNNNEKHFEEEMTAKQFVNRMLVEAINVLTNDKSIIQIIKLLFNKGINIDEETAEKIKTRLGDNLTSDISDTINMLVSENFTPSLVIHRGKRSFNEVKNPLNLEDLEEKSKSCIESKMALLQAYTKLKDETKVTAILAELENENAPYTSGLCASLLRYYLILDRLEDAEKWYNKIYEIHPTFRLDKIKALNYAECLIRNNRIEDALKVLNSPINLKGLDTSILCNKLLDSAKKCCPTRIDEFFNILQDKKYFSTATKSHLGYLINAHFDSGDIDKAVETFKWACEKYRLTPQRNKIMKKLIEDEDATSLQYVTDLCIKVHGELNALFDLAFAFFECDRLRQARKILETPGFRLVNDRVLFKAQVLSGDNDTKQLESYLQLLNGLYLDMDPLYILLLQAYERNDQLDKCLSLWTQMQEDNIAPSSEFMNHLERVLKKSKQEIPFSTSSDSNSITRDVLNKRNKALNGVPQNPKDSFNFSLIEASLNENNIDNVVKHLKKWLSLPKVKLDLEAKLAVTNIFSKLVEKDDFNAIYQIISTVKNISFTKPRYMLSKIYLESGKYKEYLTHLENLLDESKENSSVVSLMFHSGIAAKAIHNNSEIEEKLETFALKAADNKIFSPILTIWIHKFLKDSPEAEQIFEQHIKTTLSYVFSYSIIKIFENRAAFSKIPELAKKMLESDSDIAKKKYILTKCMNSILKSDVPNKYELLYECLSHGVASIGFDNINQNFIRKIEENMPNNLSIEGLKAISKERAQEKAIG